MRAKALLCDAARCVDGKLQVFGGWPSSWLYGPRRAVTGAVAGVVEDVPANRVGRRLRLLAELGRSDHGDASTWEPVLKDGAAVRVSRSVAVERLPGGPTRGKLAVPFVLNLPTVDFDRASYSWKLSLGGEQLLLPHHNVWPEDADWDGLPAGDLFLCDAAGVAGGRLYALGIRSQPIVSPGFSQRWSLAGRVSSYVERRQARKETLNAELDRAPGDAITVRTELEFAPVAKGSATFQQIELPVAADLPTLDLPRGDYAWSVDLGDFFEYVEFTVAEGGV